MRQMASPQAAPEDEDEDEEIDREFREEAGRIAIDPPDWMPVTHTWWRWRAGPAG